MDDIIKDVESGLDDAAGAAKAVDRKGIKEKVESSSALNKYGIDVENLEISATAQNHINDLYKTDKVITIGKEDYKTIHFAGESTRPYVENGTSLLIEEIINSKAPIPDPGGLPNGLRWDVPGALNGKEGIWELVIDKDKNKIVHFLFNSKK